MRDTSREQKMTAGLDLGDRCSYLCLIDTESGEVIEESRLRTTPDDLLRRFVLEEQLKIAIEVGYFAVGEPSTRRMRSRGSHSQP
jgi:hypothetical protein